MARRIIDISVALQNDVPADPPGGEPHITYIDHDQGAQMMAQHFPGLEPEMLPDGKGWAIERIDVSTHNGTHLDAPWHFHPTMDGGALATTIDEIPLNWCFQPAVKLDFRHMEDGYVVTPNDLEVEFRRIGHDLQPLEIVVINTAAGAKYGHKDYVATGCGMGRDATLWLLERGVRVTGTDAWSWDAPFIHTRKKWEANHDPSIIWEGHKVGRDIGYCHIEKLSKLETLPADGFEIACFPVKIHKASAGWCRAVAIVTE